MLLFLCIHNNSNWLHILSGLLALILFIEVLVIPRIISGPVQLKQKTLQCQFIASALPEVTVTAWGRNGTLLSNSSLYNIIQNFTAEGVVVSTLMINSSDYYGTYTCYCYYNTSLVTSSKPVVFNQTSLTYPDQES